MFALRILRHGTPLGYLDVYFFAYMHLIIGIMAIGAGAGLLAGDEEKGILDLVLAHPVSRTGLFWGRLLGLAAALAMILVAGWLSWLLPAGYVGLGLNAWELLRPFLPLFAVLLFFASLALLLSMFLPAARIAGMLAGALMVGNYLLMGLANLNDKLRPLMKFTCQILPGDWRWYGSLESWLIASALAALLFAAGAWLFFLKRDIRVAANRAGSGRAFGLRRSCRC